MTSKNFILCIPCDKHTSYSKIKGHYKVDNFNISTKNCWSSFFHLAFCSLFLFSFTFRIAFRNLPTSRYNLFSQYFLYKILYASPFTPIFESSAWFIYVFDLHNVVGSYFLFRFVVSAYILLLIIIIITFFAFDPEVQLVTKNELIA